MKKNKAFTLIELVSVLVILAILALIVTPLVLNIIRKARTAADKRSIDAYGRSIELAIADYLLDTGNFPTSIEDLTIEYSGDRVVCETAGLQPDDTSAYLANCKVNGRDVTGYTYGKVGAQSETYRAYNIGDEITYNNVNYYVMANSDETESSVTLLKATPLTVEEVNTYGEGHVNKYIVCTSGNCGINEATNQNGYGGMAYYSSSTCNSSEKENCKSDYDLSDVKYVVDAWAQEKTNSNEIMEIRLLKSEDLENLDYVWGQVTPSDMGYVPSNGNQSLVRIDYNYWTMSKYEDSNTYVFMMTGNGMLVDVGVDYNYCVVRPVIVLKKSALN